MAKAREQERLPAATSHVVDLSAGGRGDCGRGWLKSARIRLDVTGTVVREAAQWAACPMILPISA